MNRIIDTSRNHDLATIDLTEIEIRKPSPNDFVGGYYYFPKLWPPDIIRNGTIVSFVGFPGVLREPIRTGSLSFTTFGIACVKVESVSEYKFMIQFEREYWVRKFGDALEDSLRKLGGLSGSPVFTERKSAGGIHYFELVGVVCEFSESFDLMYAGNLNCIKNDGSFM